MEMCIKGAKKLIEKQVFENKVGLFGISFSSYHKSYYWTNENIKGYLDLVTFEDKDNALSVLASGDHVFNLVEKGITNIDTFDTNRLTEYYALGFKKAMILKYGYEDFLKFMQIISDESTSLDCLTELMLDLVPYMDDKYKKFWQEIVLYNDRLQKENGTNLNLMNMLCINLGAIDARICYNNYLANKEQYESLRRKLLFANITFKKANAICLEESFDSKYDYILLSNILDYYDRYWGQDWGYDCLELYEKRLELLAKSGSIIFLHYIFDYQPNNLESKLFADSNVAAENLKNEEVLKLSDDYDAMGVGMVLKRVK